MFGTLRRIASMAAAAIGLSSSVQIATPAHRYNGPPVPLLRSTRPICRYIFTSPNGGKRNRIKGAKDRSLKARSNRRKGARKAASR